MHAISPEPCLRIRRKPFRNAVTCNLYVTLQRFSKSTPLSTCPLRTAVSRRSLRTTRGALFAFAGLCFRPRVVVSPAGPVGEHLVVMDGEGARSLLSFMIVSSVLSCLPGVRTAHIVHPILMLLCFPCVTFVTLPLTVEAVVLVPLPQRYKQ